MPLAAVFAAAMALGGGYALTYSRVWQMAREVASAVSANGGWTRGVAEGAAVSASRLGLDPLRVKVANTGPGFDGTFLPSGKMGWLDMSYHIRLPVPGWGEKKALEIPVRARVPVVSRRLPFLSSPAVAAAAEGGSASILPPYAGPEASPPERDSSSDVEMGSPVGKREEHSGTPSEEHLGYCLREEKVMVPAGKIYGPAKKTYNTPGGAASVRDYSNPVARWADYIYYYDGLIFQKGGDVPFSRDSIRNSWLRDELGGLMERSFSQVRESMRSFLQSVLDASVAYCYESDYFCRKAYADLSYQAQSLTWTSVLDLDSPTWIKECGSCSGYIWFDRVVINWSFQDFYFRPWGYGSRYSYPHIAYVRKADINLYLSRPFSTEVVVDLVYSCPGGSPEPPARRELQAVQKTVYRQTAAVPDFLVTPSWRTLACDGYWYYLNGYSVKDSGRWTTSTYGSDVFLLFSGAHYRWDPPQGRRNQLSNGFASWIGQRKLYCSNCYLPLDTERVIEEDRIIEGNPDSCQGRMVWRKLVPRDLYYGYGPGWREVKGDGYEKEIRFTPYGGLWPSISVQGYVPVLIPAVETRYEPVLVP